MPTSELASLAAIVLAGFVVRLLASRGDLWLDEIISVNTARSLTRPIDVLFAEAARQDNNHPLNTLWLWLADPASSFIVSRLLSIVAGSASIALAWGLGRRWGRAAGLTAAAVFAGSSFMINYGSEARGYALLVMFTLVALLSLERGMVRISPLTMVTFWIACTLGMLSHLAFLHTFIALGTWFVCRASANRGPTVKDVRLAVIYFGPPTLFIAWLATVFINGLRVLGADQATYLDVVAAAAAHALALPARSPAALGSLIVAGVVLVWAMAALVRRRDDWWIALLMLFVGAPALMVMALQPRFLVPRYFTVPVTALLLALSFLLAAIWTRGRSGRVAAGSLMLVFLALNGYQTASLLRHGRGEYQQAMQDVVRRSPPGASIRISGDHDFRDGTVVNFYAPRFPDQTIEYVPRTRLKDEGADFIFNHSFDLERNPPSEEIADPGGRRYKLIGTYRTSRLSGWYWYVYERAR